MEISHLGSLPVCYASVMLVTPGSQDGYYERVREPDIYIRQYHIQVS